jgi:aryl-alcohol dehydrogenase-like predicted oxidoreductase
MAASTSSASTGAQAARLALGSAQFGLAYGVANRDGQVAPAEAGEIVETARSAGINTIDTAIGYGNSEACLGNIGVTDFRIVTKLPGLPVGLVDVPAWVEKEFAQALLRLRLTRVYGLLLHRPSDLSGPHGVALWAAMAELKKRQLVEKIGVSIYEPVELDFLTASFNIDLVQAPFNLLDQRLSSSGWLARLKQKNVEVHTRSAFLQGLLLMSRKEIPSKFERWNGLWDRWHQWLQTGDTTALQACLAFPLSFEQIDRVVVGADSAQQFRQILQVLARPLSHDLPELSCDSADLINPAIWPSL